MLSEEKSMAIKKGNLFVAAGASEYLSAAGTLRFLARLSGRRRHGRRSLEPSDGTAAAACCSQKLNEDEARTGTPARTRTRNTTMPTRRRTTRGDGGDGEGGGTATATAASPTSIVIPSQRQERPVTVSTRTNHLTDAFTMETATSTPPTSRGRRIQPYIATILILTYTLFGIADACSSRSTPKPRPPTPTPRPNITFHMYTCPPDYAEWYCLNGATCFTVKIVNSVLHNCLCANGYIGERCEFKDLDGSYLPSRQRVMLETASIAGGATIAVFLVVIICIAAYIHCKRKQKELRTSSNCGDTVDGPGRDPELRPFSNHGRSLRIFMAKNSNNPVASPSIEQTRMPGWNYPVPDETRMASINEGKNASQ